MVDNSRTATELQKEIEYLTGLIEGHKGEHGNDRTRYNSWQKPVFKKYGVDNRFKYTSGTNYLTNPHAAFTKVPNTLTKQTAASSKMTIARAVTDQKTNQRTESVSITNESTASTKDRKRTVIASSHSNKRKVIVCKDIFIPSSIAQSTSSSHNVQYGGAFDIQGGNSLKQSTLQTKLNDIGKSVYKLSAKSPVTGFASRTNTVRTENVKKKDDPTLRSVKTNTKEGENEPQVKTALPTSYHKAKEYSCPGPTVANSRVVSENSLLETVLSSLSAPATGYKKDNRKVLNSKVSVTANQYKKVNTSTPRRWEKIASVLTQPLENDGSILNVGDLSSIHSDLESSCMSESPSKTIVTKFKIIKPRTPAKVTQFKVIRARDDLLKSNISGKKNVNVPGLKSSRSPVVATKYRLVRQTSSLSLSGNKAIQKNLNKYTTNIVNKYKLVRKKSMHSNSHEATLTSPRSNFSYKHGTSNRTVLRTKYKVIKRSATRVHPRCSSRAKSKYKLVHQSKNSVKKVQPSRSQLSWRKGGKQQKSLSSSRFLLPGSRYLYAGNSVSQKYVQRSLRRSATRTVPSRSKLKLDRRTTSQKSSSARGNQLVMIGGILYKTNQTKLTRAQSRKVNSEGQEVRPKIVLKCLNSKAMKTVSVRGVKFKMDPSGKTLQRIAGSRDTEQPSVSRLDIGGVTYIQSKPGTLVKATTQLNRTLASRSVQKSISRILYQKPKSTKYCLFYNRFGKCNRGNECPYIHDPDRVAICTRFLRGTCKVDNCQFSHKVSKEKVPVCSYFLRGNCTKEDCPYLHVNVGKKAEICKDFLDGYCARGDKCKKKHTHICPNHDSKGSCPKDAKCRLFHPKIKEKKKQRKRGRHTDGKLIRIPSEEIAESVIPSKKQKLTDKLPSFISLLDSSLEESLDKMADTVKEDKSPLQIVPRFLLKNNTESNKLVE